mgnify:CR=1 FL=1
MVEKLLQQRVQVDPVREQTEPGNKLITGVDRDEKGTGADRAAPAEKSLDIGLQERPEYCGNRCVVRQEGLGQPLRAGIADCNPSSSRVEKGEGELNRVTEDFCPLLDQGGIPHLSIVLRDSTETALAGASRQEQEVAGTTSTPQPPVEETEHMPMVWAEALTAEVARFSLADHSCPPAYRTDQPEGGFHFIRFGGSSFLGHHCTLSRWVSPREPTSGG